ncbi:MAG: fluoride efflux transporter CrcB [Acidobacteriia bacterium]|nr:fluoride efflux transporter CrcB [Terriglobia bacterium]
MQILLLILFGAAGTLARYALQGFVQHRVGSGFPAGTMVVNLLGCFLMGVVARYCFQHLWVPPEWRVGLLLGFFGAFTTFSAFGWETVRMLEQAEWLQAGLYVLASVLGGVVAVMFGIKLADLL